MDKGLRFVLECCRTLFNYAAKRRHLSPYAENPFRVLELDRIPVENARPIHLFDADQERAFLTSCDEWQFSFFLTLMLTGMRPGELCHLLLPDDLDLDAGLVRIRNKPKLGWQVKTRNERDIPLLPELVDVLRVSLGERCYGPVFRRRRFGHCTEGVAICRSSVCWEAELVNCLNQEELKLGRALTRSERLHTARKLWRAQGCIEEDQVRLQFMRITKAIGLPAFTAPKMLRHQFATVLQEGRVDPLIRNELMGHVPAGERSSGHGLAMTAVYTHTRPETRRDQMIEAFQRRPATEIARRWQAQHRGQYQLGGTAFGMSAGDLN
jgi:integrase